MNEFNLKALPTRHLPLEGGYNFRDVGGLQNTDGRMVKRGKVFRGDELHNLTQNDLNTLSPIPMITVVDFRGEIEINNAPDRLPESVQFHHLLSIDPGDIVSGKGIDPKKVTAQEADEYMKTIYTQLATAPAAVAQYKLFFKLLQTEANLPLLFHCTAGKDRTGLGGALFLSALGVDEDTILKDYLISNVYLEEKYGTLKKENPSLRALFEVKPDFLQTALSILKEKYGSVKNYLTEALHVDIAKMESFYLD